MASQYESVIGLEVHCQLSTASKAFSPEPAEFGRPPNTNVDPVSLGHPGTLPVLNEKVVDFTVRMGIALDCEIRPQSTFARKHYFYPDLPKGYQISQFDDPICYDGAVTIQDGEAVRKIRIKRIHMEEDAGRSVHERDRRHTLLDFNRCGVPLIEIVTEPDVRSPREAYLFLHKIRQIVRYLEICDGNMEQGSLRCDANVSVRIRGASELGTKTELKNMNSMRNVEQALQFEIDRQIAVLERGGTVEQQTLLWDADKMKTRVMRSKEDSPDYRYFPDPDLPPVVVSAEFLASVRASMPELPAARHRRYLTDFGLSDYDAALITSEHEIADYFESAVEKLNELAPSNQLQDSAKLVANFVMTNVLRVVKERSVTISEVPIDPDRLAQLAQLRMANRVSSSAADTLFDTMLDRSGSASDLAAEMNLLQVSDAESLKPLVDAVLASHPQQVQAYLGGKEGILGFFIGKVMQSSDGSADPQVVRELIVSEMDKLRA